MSLSNDINVEVLDDLIIGRAEPRIYAFSTETIPNYLKVGDTYRPIEQRLNEWRRHFPYLRKRFENVAKVDEEIFFRDFAVHHFLENQLKRSRLGPNSIAKGHYYSNEFFKDATEKDLLDAIEDIKNGHKNNETKYQYYRFDESHIPITHTYNRTENYEPRPNQLETIKKFRQAIGKGRVNLLMFAVMRFGKSFTSMCCAVEMDAKLVVVVSAKADVKEEWKKTVESHLKFEGFSFLDSHSLLKNEKIISEKINNNEKIVLFLTLQDLQGAVTKSKHAEILQISIDLMLIDETHFGARATEYSKVLDNRNLTVKEFKSELKLNEATLDQLENSTKAFDTKIRIHLSGTPYRILMNSEFTSDDIIAFYQFSNIAEDQAKWDVENINRDETKEWDNPYYGFPQMIRFAFNPNESSQKKLEELAKSGITYAFSELFKPKSITIDTATHLHKKFKYEQEILDLLKIIDGSEKDTNLLSFLDYDKIIEGKMCRHLVCVLPYRASCDALEELIKVTSFKHLSDYQIINISGVESEKHYKDTQEIQAEIKKFESNNKKTITLTVNRMLTGSTVPEWDTMLYFKDTSSPQEYDQAIFRLQNQYIKVLKEPNGDVVKYNMKPQTLLVDFNPNRMFQMQEHKSQIYNVNIASNGNSQLEDRIKKELEISPIVVLNNHRIVQIQPANILDAVRKYSSSKSVLDEATTISIDLSLLDIEEIKAEIEKQREIGSRQGLEIKPSEGEGDEISIPDQPTNNEYESNSWDKTTDEKTKTDYRKKFAMFYSRILFFAFLTNSRVKSMKEIIHQITHEVDDLRIAENLELSNEILSLLQQHINPFVLSELDYKIQNINSLANDTDMIPIERASNAMRKFSRLSDAEIATPEIVTEKVIRSLPANAIDQSKVLLDIAAKQGEFAYSVFKIFGKEVANNFHSIPTSKIAYEFTRKVYSLLGLDLNLIEDSYTSYDLLKDNALISMNTIKINHKKLHFNVIVGNPPYQQKDGGANKNFASPIYNEFVDIAKKLNPNYISMIMPTRWYAGGSDLGEFRDQMLNDIHISELHDFLKPDLIFQNINLRGGICYFLWEKDYDNTSKLTRVFTYHDNLDPKINIRRLKTEDVEILIRHSFAVEMLKKVKSHADFTSFESHISALRPFGFRGYFSKDEKFRDSPKGLINPVICYGKGKKTGYLERNEISKNTGWIDKFKIYTPRANNIGTELNDDNLNTFIGSPNTICTESYIVVGVDLELDQLSATNLCKYFTTKFARFQHSIGKASQDATSKTFKFVPLQDFTAESDIDWSKTSEEIDRQLYSKYNLSNEEIEFVENMIKPMV